MPIALFLLTKSRFHILLRSRKYITIKHTNRNTDVEIYIWEMFSQRHLYFIDVKIYSVPVSSPPVLLTRNFFFFLKEYFLWKWVPLATAADLKIDVFILKTALKDLGLFT